VARIVVIVDDEPHRDGLWLARRVRVRVRRATRRLTGRDRGRAANQRNPPEMVSVARSATSAGRSFTAITPVPLGNAAHLRFYRVNLGAS